MDSSDDKTSTNSDESSEEDDSKKNGLSKRDLFLSTYRRDQNWSLPLSIIYYMAMNPKNVEVYEKLIHSCKYFFVKNPILIGDRFDYDLYARDKWSHFVYKDNYCTEFSSVTSKFWITDEFFNYPFESSPNMVSSFLPKCYRVDVKRLKLFHQNISFNDFLFLASNCGDIVFFHTVVKNEDGTIVPLEKLIKLLPRVKNVDICNTSEFSNITSNTVKELLEIPHFSKIVKFNLFNICELFDINTFFPYMKKNQNTQFCIHFFPPLSEAFKNRLEEMVDEIIESKTCGINLIFEGLDRQKRLNIRELYYHSR
uniref:DUF38 domain-containing protein n=1 Tax=Panagrolaimus sp. ES5 TaxID=591445 RepID=A0AC34F4T9_9BILA